MVHRLRRGAHVVTQEATYELVRVDGRRLHLRADIAQLGEPQWVPPRYLPPDTAAELIHLGWRAAGALEVDLGIPTPVSGSLDVVLTHHGRITADGRNHDLFSESTGTLRLTTE